MNELPERFTAPYQCTLSEELLQKAKDELFESPERRMEDIESLRSWLSEQHHIIGRTDDRFILRFLRGGKFNAERSKAKLDLYHTMLTRCPEQTRFEDPLLPQMQLALRAGMFVPMPKLLPGGRGLAIVRVAKRDPETISQDCMFQVSNMMTALWQDEEEAIQVAGVVGLVDMKGVGLAHATSMTPTRMRNAVSVWDAQPTRHKGMHYFNIPPFADTILGLFAKFMKKKLRERLFFHGSRQRSLHAEIPPDCLPEEYGGSAGKIDDIVLQWVKKMESNRDYFLANQRFGVDEKKRTRGTQSGDVIDTESSFRELEID